MNCLEAALQVSLISESLGVSASFTTMERITLENLMQEVMKLYSLAILPQARHIRFSTKEPRELRRASMSFLMKTSPLHRHPILRIPFSESVPAPTTSEPTKSKLNPAAT